MKILLILLLCSLPFQSFAQEAITNCDSLYKEWDKYRSEYLINEELPTIIGGYQKFAEHLSYTDSAKASGIEGTVLVWLVVTKTGKTKCTRIVKSLGYGLDEVVLQAISKIEFEPVKVRGQAVETALAIPARFALKPHNPSFFSRILSWFNNIF